MVLTVSHITGTGAKRNPWGVVITDGTHFWHLEPDDVSPVETDLCTGCRKPAHASETDDAGYHPGCVPTGHDNPKHSTKKHLDHWLDSYGYHHAHASKQKTPHPYAVSSRLSRGGSEPQMTNEEIRGYARAANPFIRSLALSALAGSNSARVRLAQEIDKEIKCAPSRTPQRHARKAVKAVPFSHRKCYACDSEALGVRDRRPEGGMIESACARHADPTIPAYPACYICGGRIRPTSYDVDGTFVHKACHAEDSR